MPIQPPPLLVACLLGSAGLALFLSSWAWQRRRTACASEMALLMAAVAVYTLGYSLEVSRSDLEGMMSAVRFEYLGSTFITPLFLAFAWRYTRGRALPRPLLALVLLQACSALAIVWSPGLNSLFYLNLRVDASPPFPSIAYERGPWFMVNYYALEAEGAAGMLLLVIRAFRSEPARRRQSLAIALGGSFPLLVTIAFLLGLTPERIDLTPFALALTGLVCSFALFKLGVLEIVPAAREIAIDSLRDGFVVADEKGRVQDANPAARHLLGEELREGTSLVAGSAGLEPSLEPLSRLVARGSGTEDFVAVAADGSPRHLSASAHPVTDRGRRRGTALMLRDSTETAELLARLQEQAERDSLTGLFNRRSIMERGAREIELARRENYPLGAVMVDLDHFKHINDARGHAAGDAVLAEASRRLVAAVRAVDFVGRYGGEEFVILMPGADAEHALAAAERSRAMLAASPVEWGGLAIPLTASFGVSELSRAAGEGLDDLLKRADAGLYAAKQAGRNRVAGR